MIRCPHCNEALYEPVKKEIKMKHDTEKKEPAPLMCTPLSVEVAKAMSEMCKLSHVIIIGYDGTKEWLTSYGTTLDNAKATSDALVKIQKVLGWSDEELDGQEVPKIKAMSDRIKKLERVMREALDEIFLIKSDDVMIDNATLTLKEGLKDE